MPQLSAGARMEPAMRIAVWESFCCRVLNSEKDAIEKLAEPVTTQLPSAIAGGIPDARVLTWRYAL